MSSCSIRDSSIPFIDFCVWCCHVDTTKTACHSLIGECQVVAASELLRQQATNSTHKELSEKEFQTAHQGRMGANGDGLSGGGPINMLLGKNGALADFESALKYDPHNSGASGCASSWLCSR